MSRKNLYLFFIVTLILGVISVISTFFLEMEAIRMSRVVTTIIFFLLFLKFKWYKIKLFFAVFLLFILADIGIVFFEDKWFCYLKLISTILAYFSLSTHVFLKIDFKNLKIFPSIVIGVLSISHIFLVFHFRKIIEMQMHGVLHEILFYGYSLAATMFLLSSIMYNISSDSRKADVFLGMNITFFLSDVLLMLAYYQGFFVTIQIEPIFHVLSLMLFLRYVILCEEDEVSQSYVE